MEAFQARLETFFKAKRVKNGTGKRTISVKWPHPDTITATPSALAEAGFYYDPSWDDQDNVSCFMCDKELAGWEEDDDPFQIHWEKCRDSCAWAIVRCGLDGDVDRKGKFVFKDGSRIPNGKQMEKARLTTFTTRSWWPHDTTKGHGASSTKMAKAGFVYTPSSAGDDNATCLYCNVSLGGWDEDDDPLDEHRKRQDKLDVSCPFFSEVSAGLAKSMSSKPPSRSSVRPRSRTGSRQLQPTPSDISPLNSDDELGFAPEEAPPASKRGRKPSSASVNGKDKSDTLRRSTRTRATPEVDGEASGSDLGRSTLRSSTRGKTKAKDKAKERIAVIQEEGEESDEPKPKVKTKKNVKGKENEEGDGDVEEAKEKTGKAKKGREKKEDASDDDDDAPSKPKRGRPKKKVIEVDSPEEEEEEEEEEDEEEEVVKPARKGKKKAAEPLPAEAGKRLAKKTVAKPAPKAKTKPLSPEAEEPGPSSHSLNHDDLPPPKFRAKKTSTAKAPPASTRRPKPAVVEHESSDAFSDPSDHALEVKPVKLAPHIPKAASPASSSDADMHGASEDPSIQELPPVEPPYTETRARDSHSSPSIPPPPRQTARSRTTTGSSVDSKTSKKSQLDRIPPSSFPSLHDGNRNRVASGSSVSSTVSKKGKGTPIPAPMKERDSGNLMDVDEAQTGAPREVRTIKEIPTNLGGSRYNDGMEVIEEEVLRPSSPMRPPRSPQRPNPGVRRLPEMAPSTPPRQEATPPPASSSLPSLPSFDSNTTLAPPDEMAPKRLSLSPDAGLTDEERGMTVEQWIRHEIEIQYARLQRDGEMKIRMFRERAEEVRRQIEAM